MIFRIDPFLSGAPYVDGRSRPPGAASPERVGAGGIFAGRGPGPRGDRCLEGGRRQALLSYGGVMAVAQRHGALKPCRTPPGGPVTSFLPWPAQPQRCPGTLGSHAGGTGQVMGPVTPRASRPPATVGQAGVTPLDLSARARPISTRIHLAECLAERWRRWQRGAW